MTSSAPHMSIQPLDRATRRAHRIWRPGLPWLSPVWLSPVWLSPVWLSVPLPVEAAPATSPRQVLEIVGYVTGPNNVPVTAARVRLKPSSKGDLQETLSDGQGFFRFTPSSEQRYELLVDADGYAPVKLDAFALDPRQKTRLSVRMVPTRAGVGEITELAETRALDAVLQHDLQPRLEDDLLTDRSSDGLLARIPGYRREESLPGDAYPASEAPAFHGSSGAEQRYLLDDMDVTHPLTGRAALSLPVEMLQSVQVASAGASVLDDGALGAEVQTATRFGGNRLGGDVFLDVVPYREADAAHVELSPNASAAITRQDRHVLSSRLGLGLGGYVVRDRLWYYAAAAPAVRLEQVHRCIAAPDVDATACTNGLLTLDEGYGIQGPGLARLTFNITPDQTLQLGAYGQAEVFQGVIQPATDLHTGINGDASHYGGQTRELNWMAQGRYVLRIPAVRTRASLQLGYLSTHTMALADQRDRNSDGLADGEQAETILTGLSEVPGTDCHGLPCTVADYRTGGAGELHDLATSRLGVGLELQHRIPDLLGSHFIRWGILGVQENVTHTWTLTGGNRYYYDYAASTSTTETLDSFVSGSPVTRPVYTSAGTQTLILHLQDVWEPVRGLSVRVGTRLDSPQILDANQTRVGLTPSAGLRLAARYDYQMLNQPGSFGIGLGTQHGALPLYLIDAAYNTPERTFSTVSLPGIRTTDDSPLLSPAQSQGLPPTAATAYQLASSFSLPAQQELAFQWRQALPGRIEARVGGLQTQLSQALAPMRYSADTVYLGNPGTDPDGTGAATTCVDVSVPEGTPESRCFYSPTRFYQALELSLLRPPESGHGLWLQASYLLSRLSGNYTGPVAQAPGQEPLDLSSSFSQANLPGDGTSLAATDLPGDRRHRLRGELAFDLPLKLRVGGSATFSSGTPLDLLARSALGDGGFVYLMPRGTAGRTPWLLEESLMLSYRLVMPRERVFSLSATLVNPWQRGIAAQQDSLALLSGATGPADNTSSVADALSSTTCVDSSTGESTPCVSNSQYGQGVSFPSPRTLRVSLRLSF